MRLISWPAVIPVVCLLALVSAVPVARAQPYQVGQIVTTNFSLTTRFAWTNDNGQVFTPGTPLRLSDFAGRIVLFEFFAVW
ncbi:MAG TPA: hypothetical protein VJW76_13315 [Verrucomicrobiae bacterium]|nr:hypothetical protein [Verrucomicrobiae bacterium]